MACFLFFLFFFFLKKIPFKPSNISAKTIIMVARIVATMTTRMRIGRLISHLLISTAFTYIQRKP